MEIAATTMSNNSAGHRHNRLTTIIAGIVAASLLILCLRMHQQKAQWRQRHSEPDPDDPLPGLDPELLYVESSAKKRSKPDDSTVWSYLDPVTRKSVLMASEPRYVRGEPYVVRLFDRFSCKGGQIFIDVGLSVGFYGLLARVRGCRVVAFELQPTCIAIFQRGERLNDIWPPTPVVHRPVADFDNRSFKLASHVLDTCEDLFSFFWQGNTHYNTVSLDRVLLPALSLVPGSRIGLMMIDIQGFEGWAVSGAWRLLERRQVDALIVEATWWPNVFWPIHKAYSMLAMVFDHGYTIRCIGPNPMWVAEFTDAAAWMQYGKANSAMVKIGPNDDRDISSCNDFFICISPCPIDTSPLE